MSKYSAYLADKMQAKFQMEFLTGSGDNSSEDGRPANMVDFPSGGIPGVVCDSLVSEGTVGNILNNNDMSNEPWYRDPPTGGLPCDACGGYDKHRIGCPAVKESK